MKHIAKYNSHTPAKNWGNFMDNFFNHSLSNVIGSDMRASNPAVNIVETDENFRIELAAPGLEKKDFGIEIEKDHLNIKVEKEKDETSSKTSKFTRQEFNYTSFKRSFHLPENVQIENIGATYEQGVLKVVLPKTVDAEVNTVKTIEIE